MKTALLSTFVAAATALAVVREGQAPLQLPSQADAELYLVETAPGETKWVTEDEKWELRRARLLHICVLSQANT